MEDELIANWTRKDKLWTARRRRNKKREDARSGTRGRCRKQKIAAVGRRILAGWHSLVLSRQTYGDLSPWSHILPPILSVQITLAIFSSTNSRFELLENFDVAVSIAPLFRLTISLMLTSIARLLLGLLIRMVEDKNNFSKDVNF